jgi:hypothetical protein
MKTKFEKNQLVKSLVFIAIIITSVSCKDGRTKIPRLNPFSLISSPPKTANFGNSRPDGLMRVSPKTFKYLSHRMKVSGKFREVIWSCLLRGCVIFLTRLIGIRRIILKCHRLLRSVESQMFLPVEPVTAPTAQAALKMPVLMGFLPHISNNK